MGHNAALILTFLGAWGLMKVHQWWIAKHSPTGDPDPAGGVKPQVGAGVTPDDPTSEVTEGGGKSIYRPKSGVETWLAEQPPTRRTNELIRDAARRFKVSASTVKRRLRKLREGAPR